MTTRAFDHVLIIMFENEYRGYVKQNPYMQQLAKQGIELTNSFGVMHPSQTNYIASISGELCGVTDDDQPPPLPQKTIVDLIEGSAQNLSWKAYMDSYIADDTPWQASNFTPKDHYPYVIKHNPFSSYQNILDNEQRWQRIDNEAGFWQDLLNGNFPNYAWFTPDMWHDGHYVKGTLHDNVNGERAPVLVDQQAAWLKSFFEALKFPGPDSHLPDNTLVVVTYDEADFEAFYDKGKKYTYDGPNQIYTVLLGDNIQPGLEAEGCNHYTVLKTIEKNFNLGHLGKNDQEANWFQFLWDREFRWNPPVSAPVSAVSDLVACEFSGLLYVVCANSEGNLSYCTFDGNTWSQPVSFASGYGSTLAIAANAEGILLAYQNAASELTTMQFQQDSGWQPAPAPALSNLNAIALVNMPRSSDFMLAYQTSGAELYSQILSGGSWSDCSPCICEHAEGEIDLAVIGVSLLLIYQVQKTSQLACFSYNTADFNAINVASSQYAGAYDDTTIGQWSANAFALNHFSQAADVVTPHEPEPVVQGLIAEGAFSTATLDGVVHLLHNAPGNPQLLDATFSIAGSLTPASPVSYDPAENKTTSNGYGTLAEAGWTRPVAVPAVLKDHQQLLSTARLGEQLWLLYQDLNTNQLHAVSGCYQQR